MSDHGAPPTGEMAWFLDHHDALQRNVEQFIRGKSLAVRTALVCLLARGHLLVDDVPGVGKTSLAKAISQSIDGTMRRIQFTPDLLPSDVTGTLVYDQGKREFEFRPGPVFSNIVLADEINRASPKTQSALLEVMAENQVSVDGFTYPVNDPFTVIATQNPVEHGGTYDLPEAQLDRFMMRTSMGYPEHDAEVEIITHVTSGGSTSDLKPVMTVGDVQRMISIAQRVSLAPPVVGYITTICAATRTLPDLRLGASPRGSVAVAQASQAYAATQGRHFVTPDDVKAVVPHVLAHRLDLRPEAELQGRTAEDLLDQVLTSVPVPQHRAV